MTLFGENEPMRLLAVKQPWATLLILNFKPVENRPWGTDFRGRVAILASKAPDFGERALTAMTRCLPSVSIRDLPTGKVIGSVELYDVTERMDSWWFTGPVGLLVRNPRQLERGIDHRGQLGLVACPEHIQKAIIASL